MNFEPYMLPCLFKKLTGFDCLGCGFQRAFFLLLEGNISEAFTMFPPILTSVLFLISLTIGVFTKSIIPQKVIVFLAFLNVIVMLISYYFK